MVSILLFRLNIEWKEKIVWRITKSTPIVTIFLFHWTIFRTLNISFFLYYIFFFDKFLLFAAVALQHSFVLVLLRISKIYAFFANKFCQLTSKLMNEINLFLFSVFLLNIGGECSVFTNCNKKPKSGGKEKTSWLNAIFELRSIYYYYLFHLIATTSSHPETFV